MSQPFISYLLKQQKNRQWDFFLQSFARVFSSQLSSEDLRDLMKKIGDEAAKELELEQVQTLIDLEQSLNLFWEQVQWGVCSLEEGENSLHIKHFYSPLLATFKDEDLVWVVGFLEGLYQHVFNRLGAGSELQVQWQQVEEEESLSFQLSF